MPHVPQEERRPQLVAAAIRVIAREGVARATTRRIAEEAGCSGTGPPPSRGCRPPSSSSRPGRSGRRTSARRPITVK
ncbi:TetR family transcriptional regulator [Pseudonocardia oroxyli]|uniref:TetR family transcriptional regulator n=1 Tax=Pseudonocardia oroxyli TaxID=366584 RepID=UPI000B81E676